MIKSFKILIHEPLIHFLILGCLLYFYNLEVSKGNDGLVQNSISLTQVEKKRLREAYPKAYKFYAQKYLREKMFLKEALRIELYKEDDEISKILQKKMEFIVVHSIEYNEPTQEQLLVYYELHKDDYLKVEQLSFVHIYLSENSSQEYKENLEKILNYLNVQAEDAELFTENFSDGFFFKNISYKELQSIFGKYFTKKVFLLRKNCWSQLLHSKYGEHFVYVTAKKGKIHYTYNEVMDRVYRDYLQENKIQGVKRAYKSMLNKYTLEPVK